MAKALGLLPSWYWPEGVQRYLKAPRVPLYELAVGRWARRYGGDAALIAGGDVRSFRELDAACAAVAAQHLAWRGDTSRRVALAVRSPDSFAPLFLGSLRADATLLVLSEDVPVEQARRALVEFGADLLISDGPAPFASDRLQRLEPGAFLEPSTSAPPRINIDAARVSIAMPGSDGLAWHSHMTLMSAAIAFAAFIRLEPPAKLVAARPPGSWEGLVGLLAPLQVGATAIPGGDGPDELAALVRTHAPRHVWVDEADAEPLLHEVTPLASALRDVRPNLFVTAAGPFPRYVRRSLRRVLKAPVLTVFGRPETGAIAAAHPSWYLDEAIGIPMTGVNLVPLNPRTGQAVEAPWDLLAYAQIGVQTSALAANVGSAPEGGAPGDDEVDTRCYNTRTLGVIDANGMLFLLG